MKDTKQKLREALAREVYLKYQLAQARKTIREMIKAKEDNSE